MVYCVCCLCSYVIDGSHGGVVGGRGLCVHLLLLVYSVTCSVHVFILILCTLLSLRLVPIII